MISTECVLPSSLLGSVGPWKEACSSMGLREVLWCASALGTAQLAVMA